MINKILVFAGLLYGCSLPLHAQKLQLSAEGGLQQSWIPDYTETVPVSTCPPGSGFCSITSSADVRYSYAEKPGAYLKGLLAYSLTTGVQLYHNLNLNLLRFKAETEVDIPEGVFQPEGGLDQNIAEGHPFYYYYMGNEEQQCRDAAGNAISCENIQADESSFYQDDRIGKTSMLYLTQEIGSRYMMLPRLWLWGGVDVSYRLYSQVYVPSFRMTSTSPGEGRNVSGGGSYDLSYDSVRDTSGRGFGDVLLGVQAGAAYAITQKFAVSTAIQHSLSEVTENSNATFFRLGVQYKLKGW